MNKQHYMTVKAAAERVERTPRQIETWIADGLKVYRFGGRKRYVREDQLLAMLRSKLLANPNRRRRDTRTESAATTS